MRNRGRRKKGTQYNNSVAGKENKRKMEKKKNGIIYPVEIVSISDKRGTCELRTKYLKFSPIYLILRFQYPYNNYLIVYE